MLLRTAVVAFALAASNASAQTTYNTIYQDGMFKISYGYLAINIKAAQALKLTGKGVSIAVFDTGLDVTNPKFQGNLITGWNIYGNNGRGAPNVTQDHGWHGTLVSGIIAANALTGQGSNIYGIASEAKIMPIQIFDQNGRAAWTDQQFYTAINYAMLGIQKTPIAGNNKVGIFNNSWNSSRTLADLGDNTAWINSNHRMMLHGWNLAAQRNILNMWAAGNFSKRDPGYLATMPSIDPRLASSWIVVVATDRTGALASYSNACGIASSYCMAAPGSNILGVYTNTSGVRTLATGSGTSFAAPMVSASAALIWQHFPYLKAWEVQQILFRSADKTGVYANSSVYGQGMLNLTRAFEPIGTLRVATTKSVTGPNAAITGSSISPGGALEGPLLAALGNRTMMLLDDFDRGYDVRLRSTVVRTQPLRDRSDDLGSYGAMETQVGDATVLRGSAASDPTLFAYVTDARGMVSAYGQNVRPSLAYGPYANGLLRPNDLVLPDQVGNPYMDLAPNGTVMVSSYDWGQGRSTRIGAFTNEWRQDSLKLNQDLPRMSGANIEHTIRSNGWWFSANIGYVNETKTLLGGKSDGVLALGSGGASTAFGGMNAGVTFSQNWNAFIGANIGHTRPDGGANGVITRVDHLVSGNAHVGLTKTGIINDRDRIGIVAGLPLGVGHGRINMQIPTSRDGDSITMTNQSIRLKPRVNEWSAQMFYDHSTTDAWSIGVGVGARFNSVAHAGEHDLIMLSRFRLQF